MSPSPPMKLNLRQEENVAILDVEGGIDVHNFAVLKAGLSKLLGHGKNRIVLHIPDAGEIAGEVLRELAILDVFARELSGKLVLASESSTLKAQVMSFAKPPIVAILPSVAKAVEYLRDLDTLEGDEAGESMEELHRQLEASGKRIAALEAQVQQANPAELQKLRGENADLHRRVKLLEAQVGDFAEKRRAPTDAEGFVEKFAALEETIKKLGGEKMAGAKK